MLEKQGIAISYVYLLTLISIMHILDNYSYVISAIVV